MIEMQKIPLCMATREKYHKQFIKELEVLLHKPNKTEAEKNTLQQLKNYFYIRTLENEAMFD